MNRKRIKLGIMASLVMVATTTTFIPVQAVWNLDSNENWYWMEEGQKATGWRYINSKWYYFNSDGTMRKGWLYENGNWYCLADDGHMFTGWICYSKKWYHMKSDGSMSIGWLHENGKDYYLESDGVRATGVKDIEGKRYEFSEKGELISVNEIVKEDIKDTIDKPIINSGTQNKPNVDTSINNSILKPPAVGSTKPMFNNDTVGFNQTIRDKEPNIDDRHYYSNSNLFYSVKLSPPFYSGSNKIKGNCTWYAWGRIYEMTGKAPTDAGLNGNAYEWWEANKRTGKYQYGTEPRLGAIAVWKSSLPGSGGCGHVAIVEKIENGKVFISESSWHGTVFRYREIYSTDHLYGYIYTDKPNF